MADLVSIDTDADYRIDPAAAAILFVLSLPENAFAIQVGCFITAVLLGFMFLLSLGITLVLKSLLARRLGGTGKTPWGRIIGLTVIELFLFVLVFAVTRTSFPVTLIIYLPFGVLANSLLLSKPLRDLAVPLAAKRRFALFALLALSLPAAIQIAGLVWSVVTGLITFTELRA